MEHPFRNAAFGGFNRQDVLDYLEKTAADNAQRQQQLQQQLQQAMERAEARRSGPPSWRSASASSTGTGRP